MELVPPSFVWSVEKLNFKFKYHFLQMYFLAFLTNLLLHINYYKVIITRDLIM
jgi:hypothetical protein